jgi:hypothetical protein
MAIERVRPAAGEACLGEEGGACRRAEAESKFDAEVGCTIGSSGMTLRQEVSRYPLRVEKVKVVWNVSLGTFSTMLQYKHKLRQNGVNCFMSSKSDGHSDLQVLFYRIYSFVQGASDPRPAMYLDGLRTSYQAETFSNKNVGAPGVAPSAAGCNSPFSSSPTWSPAITFFLPDASM